jgi:ribosomal protein S18 acetylase RimI-like enzyme
VESAIRPATAADVRHTLELWRQSGAEPTPTDDEGSLRKLIAHDPSSLLLADFGGRIVGSVIAAWDGWRGSIYRLVVAPELRRQGLG